MDASTSMERAMNQMLKSIRPLFVLMAGLAWMSGAAAVTQTRSPSACANVTGIGTDVWSSPGSATASDDVRATVVVNDNEISNYLGCTTYNFNIPAAATIKGIQVNVERRSS